MGFSKMSFNQDSLGEGPGTERQFRILTLRDFLESISAVPVSVPVAVHSMSAARIAGIVNTESLLASPCNVFTGECICYLFVGRPAYKKHSDSPASWWQCPVVFLIKSISKLKIKRIFPFDSGAFAAGHFPGYITEFPLCDFSLGEDPAIIERFISVFFRTREEYLRGETSFDSPTKKILLNTPKLMRIGALAQLYSEPASSVFDDRGRTIEVQVGAEIAIDKNNVYGVILPEPFESDNDLQKFFSDREIRTDYYPIFPLSVQNYYSEIYTRTMRMAASADREQ